MDFDYLFFPLPPAFLRIVVPFVVLARKMHQSLLFKSQIRKHLKEHERAILLVCFCVGNNFYLPHKNVVRNKIVSCLCF